MRIKEIRTQKGISQKELALALGIAPNTLCQYENKKRTPDIDIVAHIADYFHVSVDYLISRSELPPTLLPEDRLSENEQNMVKKYRLLDPYGKEAVDGVLTVEWRRCTRPTQEEQLKQLRPTVTLRRPFTQVAAAEGAGAFLLDSDYDEVTVELNQYTQKADIILKVVGRSMEPLIHDKDQILVREQPSVEEGEIGVFLIDGNGFLKESAPDRLVSLNPNIDDVLITGQQTVECYGKYICVLEQSWIIEK